MKEFEAEQTKREQLEKRVAELEGSERYPLSAVAQSVVRVVVVRLSRHGDNRD